MTTNTPTPEYLATKYSEPADELLHDLASYWDADYDGEVDSPTGWWMVLDVEPEDLAELREQLRTFDRDRPTPTSVFGGERELRGMLDNLDRYAPPVRPGSTWLDVIARDEYYARVLGHFLLSGDDRGFCYVERFPLTPEGEQERDDKVEALDEEYGAWASAEDDFDTMNPNT